MKTRTQAKAKQKFISSPSFSPIRNNFLQRKCACGKKPSLTGECTECHKRQLQRRDTIQRESDTIPPIVYDVLRSPGKPLDFSTRSFMESKFGYNFGHVRVHTDTQAAESAKMIKALAYTVGRDVVFANGQYSPATLKGKNLLAHELTHVVQQEEGLRGLPNHLSLGAADDALEVEADRVAKQVIAEPSRPGKSTGKMVESALDVEQRTSALGAISRINASMQLQRRCQKSAAQVGYPVDVNLDIPKTPTPDHSHDVGWISNKVGDESELTAGLTDYDVDMKWNFRTRTRGDQTWVTGIKVWLRSPSIRIFIANEMDKGSCEFKDLLRHEKKHEKDYRKNTAEAEKGICKSAAVWPTQNNTARITHESLEKSINSWMEFEKWKLKYNNALDTCAWEIRDYPRLYTGCPNTSWTAPEAICPELPQRP